MNKSVGPVVQSTIVEGRIVYYVKTGKEVKLFYRKEKAEDFARRNAIVRE